MRIAGPHKEGSRWAIRWTDADGKRKAFARADRAEVLAKKRELLGVSPHATTDGGVNLAPLPDGEMNAAWWSEVTRAVMDAGHASTVARDLEALDALSKYGRLTGEMYKVWEDNSGNEERDEEFAKLTEVVEGQQKRGRLNAAQPSAASSINHTLEGRPRPPTTVH